MTIDLSFLFRSASLLGCLAVAGAIGVATSPAHAQVSYTFTGSNSGGWTATRSGGDDNTAWQAGAAGWTTTGWDGGANNEPATYLLSSPTVTVTSAGTLTGSFTHRFNFENTFDGGQYQYSVNGGGWTAVPQALITGTTYTHTVSGSDLDGQLAFTGTSSGYATPSYVTSSFTLGAGSPLSFSFGDQVQVRFVAAWDGSVLEDAPNWQIAGLTLNGVAAVPEPSTYALAAGSCALVGAWWRRRRPRQA